VARRRELPLDRDDVEPRCLACDEPVAEFEDAKDPEPGLAGTYSRKDAFRSSIRERT
jgi:hypothetical protein